MYKNSRDRVLTLHGLQRIAYVQNQLRKLYRKYNLFILSILNAHTYIHTRAHTHRYLHKKIGLLLAFCSPPQLFALVGLQEILTIELHLRIVIPGCIWAFCMSCCSSNFRRFTETQSALLLSQEKIFRAQNREQHTFHSGERASSKATSIIPYGYPRFRLLKTLRRDCFSGLE